MLVLTRPALMSEHPVGDDQPPGLHQGRQWRCQGGELRSALDKPTQWFKTLVLRHLAWLQKPLAKQEIQLFFVALTRALLSLRCNNTRIPGCSLFRFMSKTRWVLSGEPSVRRKTELVKLTAKVHRLLWHRIAVKHRSGCFCSRIYAHRCTTLMARDVPCIPRAHLFT